MDTCSIAIHLTATLGKIKADVVFVLIDKVAPAPLHIQTAYTKDFR